MMGGRVSLVATLSAAMAVAAAVLAFPGLAAAYVSDPVVIDGPSADIVGDPQAAMSEDGTGGVAYLKRVDGRAHVFAAAFVDGQWQKPQRVDVGQNYDSSWPRIAAGDNGRLLVTWVQDFGVQFDRMFSATMDPGSNGFQPPVPVDFDIGEATSTYPDLAMNRGGQAYLVYNVVTDTSAANPPGYVGLDVRVARYSNRLWSNVGARMDRNATLPMRIPTATTAPQIGIDLQGQAVVAWLEPGDDFVDRVWARRIFGSQTGIPLRVSPDKWPPKDGQPVRGGVTGFSLDVSGFGQSAIAFVQQPGQNQALGTTRVMTNGMPDVFSVGGGTFADAQIADGEPRGSAGAPAVAVDPTGIFAAAFGSGPSTLLSTGDVYGVYGVERVDTGASTVDGFPQVDISESGAGVVAWRELRSAGGDIGVQERRADGVLESTALTTRLGGVVGAPALAGSGFGDATLAWLQGTGANRHVAAAFVDAPPDPFLVLTPGGWKRQNRVGITWDPSPHAIGGVTYSVAVDDEPVLDGIRGQKAKLGPKQIGNGRHRIQIFAADTSGQETGSLVGRLSIDRRAPQIRVQRRGAVVKVKIDDGPASVSSGLRTGKVSYGDGTSGLAKGRRTAHASHRFRTPGRYLVKVEARDGAGNEVSKKIGVKIR